MQPPQPAIRLAIQPAPAKSNKVTRSTLQKFELRVTNSDLADTPPLFCSSCGKNMQNPRTGTNIIGVSFKFVAENPLDAGFLNEQLAPLSADKTYYVCYGCWLQALGIKPESRVQLETRAVPAVPLSVPVPQLEFAPDNGEPPTDEIGTYLKESFKERLKSAVGRELLRAELAKLQGVPVESVRLEGDAPKAEVSA